MPLVAPPLRPRIAMTSRAFRVDALPSGVFELLAGFLTGFDLLRLSHVNRRFRTELLGHDALEWQRRVPHSSRQFGAATKTAKEWYCASRSVAFPGRGLPRKLANERGGAVELWSQGMPDYWLQRSFSFELWFALLPGDDDPRIGVHFGGVIFGAQSVMWAKSWWPDFHQQFVHVDPHGELFCSVIDTTKVAVAKNLRPQRWYHLALTFTRGSRGEQSTQRVYLDGELVQEAIGQLHNEASQLYFGQLGSGCISGAAPGKPTEDFCGWYSFNGVVDGCRLWRGVLRPDHVQRAARGTFPTSHAYGEPVLVQELHADNMKVLGPAWRVRCTRPLERIYAELGCGVR